MAQAGGKNPAGIPDAIASVKDALSGMIKYHKCIYSALTSLIRVILE